MRLTFFINGYYFQGQIYFTVYVLGIVVVVVIVAYVNVTLIDLG
jgi:hypothetical protein